MYPQGIQTADQSQDPPHSSQRTNDSEPTIFVVTKGEKFEKADLIRQNPPGHGGFSGGFSSWGDLSSILTKPLLYNLPLISLTTATAAARAFQRTIDRPQRPSWRRAPT